MSEGKLLKTRFDEIFAATKYIKALDCLRKVRLETSQLVKQKDIEKKVGALLVKNKLNELKNNYLDVFQFKNKSLFV